MKDKRKADKKQAKLREGTVEGDHKSAEELERQVKERTAQLEAANKKLKDDPLVKGGKYIKLSVADNGIGIPAISISRPVKT